MTSDAKPGTVPRSVVDDAYAHIMARKGYRVVSAQNGGWAVFSGKSVVAAFSTTADFLVWQDEIHQRVQRNFARRQGRTP